MKCCPNCRRLAARWSADRRAGPAPGRSVTPGWRGNNPAKHRHNPTSVTRTRSLATVTKFYVTPSSPTTPPPTPSPTSSPPPPPTPSTRPTSHPMTPPTKVSTSSELKGLRSHSKAHILREHISAYQPLRDHPGGRTRDRLRHWPPRALDMPGFRQQGPE